MSDSLSILVPVRNAEASLAMQVEQLLEILPDLTPRFEILVVDDGSTDHTADVARELARAYPQLRLVRHTQPRGAEATIETGLRWAQGQTVFVQEDPAALSATELRRLWSLRIDPAVRPTPPRRPGLFDPALLERLTTWGQALKQLSSGQTASSVQMLRRPAGGTIAVAGLESESQPSSRSDAAHPSPPPRDRNKSTADFFKHLRDLALGE